MFTNEFLDKAWNLYKLASVSRKQGLPTMAVQYLSALSHQVSPTFESDVTKYERYKFDYEYIKLQLEYNTNPDSLNRFVEEYSHHIQKNYLKPMAQAKEPGNQPHTAIFENYQAGDLLRLLGDHFFKQGNLSTCQSYLKESLALNKKEAKTWLSYARLNQ